MKSYWAKLCAVLATLPGAVNATLLWDNGVTSINSYSVSQPSSEQVVYDDFTTATPIAMTGVTFKGGYNGNISRSDNFVIRLHSDGGGIPDLIVFSQVFIGTAASTVFGTSSNGTVIYQYSIDIDLALEAGTYWISIFSSNTDLPTRLGRWVWVHQFEPSSGNEHVSNLANDTLLGYPYDSDFVVNGNPIPAPPSL